MAMEIKELSLPEMQAALKTKTARVEYIFSNEPDDAKIPGAMKQEIIDTNKEIEVLQVAVKEATEMAGIRAKADETKSWMQQSAGNMRHQGGTASGEVLAADTANAEFRGGIGAGFLDNPTFKSWSAQAMPGGLAPSKDTSVRSPGVAIPDLNMKNIKTLVTSGTTDVGRYTNTTGGALVRPQYVDMVALPFRPLKLREVVTVIQATSPLIEYPQVTGYTNAAGFVPEAQSTTDPASLKPESALALALRTSVASIVAHYMPISRQALSDAPQLRDLMDTFLLNGLDQAVEDAMISGNGAGSNLTGIVNISGVSQQAFVVNNFTTMRKAITKAQIAPIFVEPNAFVMSPQDWEGVDLAQDNEMRYYYGGPSQTGTPRLWGKPVIVAQAVPQGTVFTGDLKNLVLADLMAAQMFVTDSHADWFVRNLLAILAELRLHFFCLRPAAVIQCTLGAW